MFSSYNVINYWLTNVPFALLSTYLGLPLGASFKSIQAWDVVEEGF